MWPRLSIVAGLVAGVAVAALVLGAILVPSARGRPVAADAADGRAHRPASPSPPSAVGRGAVGDGARLRRPLRRRSSAAALFHIGEPAPALVVPQVGGGTIDLANLKGKPVWVNFMGTYCPPCHDEFPLMNGFAARYADDGLVVLAIDVKEDEGTVAAFANDLNATFPLGLDTDGAAADRLGCRSRCRSTSGSTRTGSCATARSAASGPTSWPAASARSCRA